MESEEWSKIDDVLCCICGKKLTTEENNENSTYDKKERMCNVCLNDPFVKSHLTNILEK